MALNHVCIWDNEEGYRPITLEEAVERFPNTNTITANTGIFVCELCGDNVGLSVERNEKGKTKKRHFYHINNTDAECEDRAKRYYSENESLFKQLSMPIHLKVTGSKFFLEMGLFLPHDVNKFRGKYKIIISGDNSFRKEFNSERIGDFVKIGDIPSEKYKVSFYPNTVHRKYSFHGIDKKGALFDMSTGRLLRPGSKIKEGQDCYLLTTHFINNIPQGMKIEKIEKNSIRKNNNVQWHLYGIKTNKFSEGAAQFFLQFSIFLSKNVSSFYPIWPPYREDSYFYYFDANQVFFYFKGEANQVEFNPAAVAENRRLNDNDEWLYRINLSTNRYPYITLNIPDGQGLFFLQRKERQFEDIVEPKITIIDSNNKPFGEKGQEVFYELPKDNILIIKIEYDGRLVIYQHEKIVNIIKLSSNRWQEIKNIFFNCHIDIYQGCDCVRSLQFVRKRKKIDFSEKDQHLTAKLQACRGDLITVPHSSGAMIDKFDGYTLSKKWITAKIRQGKMSRKAYQLIKKELTEMMKGN